MENIFATRYLLIEKIGSGGFSEVWKAKDLEANEILVAVKIYSPQKGLDNIGLELFKKEYSLVYDLNHPNILKPNYYGNHKNHPYLVIPYCPNGTAMRLVGRINEKLLARLIHQIASALAYMHSRKNPVLHRDIKPENILIDNEYNFLLTDFGISSRIFNNLTDESPENAGTLAYLPPEHFYNNYEQNPAADIFSLGITIFELATGNLPFGENGGLTLHSQNEKHYANGFSKGFNNLINKCLTQNPQDRPTANELAMFAKYFIKTGNWNWNKINKTNNSNKINAITSESLITNTFKNTNNRRTEQKFSVSFLSENRKKAKNNVHKKLKVALPFLIVAILSMLLTAFFWKFRTKNYKFELIIEQADRYFEDKNFAKAFLFYNKALDLKPEENTTEEKAKICLDSINTGFETNFATAQFFDSTLNFNKAIEAYKKALQYKPDNQLAAQRIENLNDSIDNLFFTLINNGKAKLEQKKWKPALIHFKKAAELIPNNNEINNLIDSTNNIIEAAYLEKMISGDEFMNIGSYKKAKNEFLDALNLKDNDVNAQLKLDYIETTCRFYNNPIVESISANLSIREIEINDLGTFVQMKMTDFGNDQRLSLAPRGSAEALFIEDQNHHKYGIVSCNEIPFFPNVTEISGESLIFTLKFRKIPLETKLINIQQRQFGNTSSLNISGIKLEN